MTTADDRHDAATGGDAGTAPRAAGDPADEAPADLAPDDRDAGTSTPDDAPAIDPRDPLGLGWDDAVDDPTTDGTARDGTAVEDTAVEDTAVEDTAVEDTAVDGTAVDERVAEGVDGPAVDDLAVDGPAVDDLAADELPPDGPVVDDLAVHAPAHDDPDVGAVAAHGSDAAHGPAGPDVAAGDEPAPASAVAPLADGPTGPPTAGDAEVPAGQVPDADLPAGQASDDVTADGADAVPAAAPPVHERHERPVGERSAWARLAHAMRPRTTTGQLLTAALCALLGFALVVQVRQTTDTQLGSLRQDDLVRLLDETTTRADELAQEAADLQREHDELLSGSDRQQAALDAARRNAATQGILTGRLPATGPGVRVTLTETSPSIRAATMLHVLEELRNAGAEAIQVNDRRVTASSAFTGAPGEIVLDGVTLSPPYRWLVIGEPDTIATALEIPGGAVAKVRTDGGRGTVETLERVDVTALRELPEPVHATPVPDGG